MTTSATGDPATPRPSPASMPGRLVRPEPVEAPPPRRRVLLAEDEALIRLDLKEMLEEEGFDVCGEAGDGETVVRMAFDLRPDLVILDVQMPVLDGIAAAEQIATARLAPVVILTAFSQRDLVERARDAGAMAYLVKPFQKKDLLPTIEMAMSRFAEIASLEHEVKDLSGRLEVRKTVERAKGVLQSQHAMSEPEAFRWIQRTSMNRRSTMKAVAEGVLAGTDVPAHPSPTTPADQSATTPADQSVTTPADT